MKPDQFIDVRFTLKERPDDKWDLYINTNSGKRVSILGPLSWDDAVKECNRCMRLRHDYIQLHLSKDKK